MTRPDEVVEGLELEPLERTPDAVDLFLYSASVWLPHRIHYDVAYTTGEEGHPALVVQGPLQGVYLMQLLGSNFGPAAVVRRLVFRHEAPVYVGQRLRCRGRVTAVDRAAGEVVCELWTELDDDRRATIAQAHIAVAAVAP
ncbi:MAG: hypothetical protein M3253_09330 [Chloroflexota bacterium]|nr:hypothetical protein [Chloroflexota bacterium]